MSKLQPVRGTRDIFGADAAAFEHVVSRFKSLAKRFGFQPIQTPIFEFSHVFARTMGDSSDVVAKEMYVFEDRGGESLALRPENTAGIARAYLSSGLQQFAPVKVYADGPMFRYERPQKGRYRQFHQLDAEVIGAAEPEADIELISMAALLLEDLGITQSVTLHVNTLADPQSRSAYRAAVQAHFKAHADQLSKDSLVRLEKNPLRILDSKDAGDREVCKTAPVIDDYLSEDAAAFFGAVLRGLDALDIAYVRDQHLVRGLDYYSHTVFEFLTGDLGAQNAVLSGGRYDGLIEQLGGPATPGCGWAAGLERLAMLAREETAARAIIAIIPMGEAADVAAQSLAQDIRRAGLAVDMAYRGNFKKRMKRANSVSATHAVILGEDEIKAGTAAVKDMRSGAQQSLPMADLLSWAKALASAH
ncbi:MAG: histidine--tRNA ligase [Pseudomonadota bacterium]